MIVNAWPNGGDSFRDVISAEINDDIAFKKASLAVLDDAFGEGSKLAVEYIVLSDAFECAGLVEGR